MYTYQIIAAYHINSPYLPREPCRPRSLPIQMYFNLPNLHFTRYIESKIDPTDDAAGEQVAEVTRNIQRSLHQMLDIAQGGWRRLFRPRTSGDVGHQRPAHVTTASGTGRRHGGGPSTASAAGPASGAARVTTTAAGWPAGSPGSRPPPPPPIGRSATRTGPCRWGSGGAPWSAVAVPAADRSREAGLGSGPGRPSAARRSS